MVSVACSAKRTAVVWPYETSPPPYLQDETGCRSRLREDRQFATAVSCNDPVNAGGSYYPVVRNVPKFFDTHSSHPTTKPGAYRSRDHQVTPRGRAVLFLLRIALGTQAHCRLLRRSQYMAFLSLRTHTSYMAGRQLRARQHRRHKFRCSSVHTQEDRYAKQTKHNEARKRPESKRRLACPPSSRSRKSRHVIEKATYPGIFLLLGPSML
ncbi:hypothetical protein FA95DRAFT_485971 [Auriscalpium vulgare]|uniref:Uncharacterized protein n=1 Tax=Auriscalpium vulgare TaxID=40419 RepID=A0ACB8SC46_9AGAM|nr:hypothetical protein FA95DRAFT_485971 [Auriscalpium vulgare]